MTFLVAITWIKDNWKLVAAIGAALVLLAFGWWFRSVLAERSSLRDEKKELCAEVDQAHFQFEAKRQEMERYVQLNRGIADAIQKIKIQSNTFIQRIDSAPSHVLNGPDVFIPGGVLMPGVFAAADSDADRAAGAGTAVAPSGGGVPAESP